MMPCPSVSPAHSHPPVPLPQLRVTHWLLWQSALLPHGQPYPCGRAATLFVYWSYMHALVLDVAPPQTLGRQYGGGSSWLLKTVLPRITLAPSFLPMAFQKFTALVQPCVQLSWTRLYSKVTAAVPCACSAPPPLLPTNSELRIVTLLIGPSPQCRNTAYWDGMWLSLVALTL